MHTPQDMEARALPHLFIALQAPPPPHPEGREGVYPLSPFRGEGGQLVKLEIDGGELVPPCPAGYASISRSLLIDFLIFPYFPHFWTWILDFRAFQPVPGRKFDVESEFAVRFAGFQRPGAKI